MKNRMKDLRETFIKDGNFEERAHRIQNDASHVSVMEIERVARNAREAINVEEHPVICQSSANCAGKKYLAMKSFCSMQMFV